MPATVLAMTAGLITTGANAEAATTAPVIVTATGACGTNRTLNVTDTGGTTLGSNNGLNASNGAAGFVTDVTDTSNCDVGFNVAATMSNLYEYSGGTSGTWTCSTDIPAANVSLNQGTTPLTLSGVTALVSNPELALTGVFNSLSVLGITLPNVNSVLQAGSLPSVLSQSSLGLATGVLTNGTLGALPLQITPYANTGAFTTAATAPSGSGCSGGSSSPTSITLMTASSNSGLLTSGVTNALDQLSSLSTGTTPIPVTDLITDGVLTQAQVLNDVLPSSLVGLVGSISQTLINTILGDVTAVVSTSNTTLSSLTESGLYTALSNISVNTASATAGEYEGALTITLTTTS